MVRSVLFSVLVFTVATSTKVVLAQEVVEISAASRIALGIETALVEESESYSSATTSGLVIAPPHQTVNIISPFDAVMLQPLVVPGSKVEDGQAVAILQSSGFAAAQAELETAVINAKHDNYLAKNALELEKLGLRSAQEADEANHEAETSMLKLRAMQAKLATVTPSETPSQFILSSFSDGIVAHINATSGAAVDTTMPVVTLFKGQEYWASAQLPERLHNFINLGMEVSLNNTESHAEVIAIDPEVDQESRSIEVLVKLPQGANWYLGQLIDLSFNASVEPESLSIPSRAIVYLGGAPYVFLQSEDEFSAVPIQIVSRGRDMAIVLGELSQGSAIVISGLAALKNLIEGA